MTEKSIKWDGKQITKPGTYAGIPLQLYHQADICDGPSISSSGLRKLFSKSPAHFYATWQGNPRAKDESDKRHYVLGRAVHHLVLGEPYFAKLFCVQPEELPDDHGVLLPWQGNRKVCKQWLAARKAEGRSPLTHREIEQIKQMVISVGNHPLVKQGALHGLIERSMFWKDKETGIWLKARPDAIPTDSGDFTDLKTCQSVVWGDLVSSVTEFGYHAQGALIREGARALLDMKQTTFTLIFVEKNDPYCTRVVQMKDSDLDRGHKQNHAALAVFAECVRSKRWPGPGGDREDAEFIELSERGQRAIDDKLTIMGRG